MIHVPDTFGKLHSKDHQHTSKNIEWDLTAFATSQQLEDISHRVKRMKFEVDDVVEVAFHISSFFV